MKPSKTYKKVYTYEPVMFDEFNPPKCAPPAGTKVRKIEMVGCPKSGSMGFTYIATLDGEFAGMVLGDVRNRFCENLRPNDFGAGSHGDKRGLLYPGGTGFDR